MTITMFGATGYLGSHAAEQLVLAGHSANFAVRASSDQSFLNGLVAADGASVRITTVDFDDAGSLTAVIDGASTVINCVADTRMHISDSERRKVEVDLTSRLFKAAQQAGAKRFIQLSTVMVYGFERPEYAVNENYPTKPKYSYSRIAVEREQTLLALQPESGVELIILRPSNTLGKRDASALPSLLGSLKKGLFPVVGGGAWNYSCMDARDVGRAIVHLLTVNINQSEIFLAKAYDINWLDVKDELDKKLGKPSKLQNIPRWLALCLGTVFEVFTAYGKEPPLTRFAASVVSSHTLFDDTKIRKTGFKPLYDLSETLSDALEQ